MTNEELGNSELVFKFLGPLDWIQHEEGHDGWLWDLLGGIASFLTPSVDDEVNTVCEANTKTTGCSYDLHYLHLVK